MDRLTHHVADTFGINLDKTNLSLYAVPIAYILALLPHVYLEIAMISATGKWSNTAPRGNVDAAQQKLSPTKLAQFKRAQGAHTNGTENLALFVAGVLAANWANVPTLLLNQIAFLYIALRFVYNPVYIFGSSKIISILRSTIWFAAQGCSLYLLKLAADKRSGFDSTQFATTFLLPPAGLVLVVLGLRLAK